MSGITEPIELTLNWSNQNGFDRVLRLKIEHRFKGNIIEQKIIDRSEQSNFFQNNVSGLTASFEIERLQNNVGKHSFKMFYSFTSSGDLWIDLLGGKVLTADITREHIGLDFSSEQGERLSFKPTFEDASTFDTAVTGEVLKYSILNDDIDIFDTPIEFFMRSTDNGFYIRKEGGVYLTVGSDGSISDTTDITNATPLYRGMLTVTEGNVIKIISTNESPSDTSFRVLYTEKTDLGGPGIPKFITISNVDSFDKINMVVRDLSSKTPYMSGEEQINFGTTDIRRFRINQSDRDVNSQNLKNREITALDNRCKQECINEPSCKGISTKSYDTSSERQLRSPFCYGTGCPMETVYYHTGDQTCTLYNNDGSKNETAKYVKKYNYTEF